MLVNTVAAVRARQPIGPAGIRGAPTHSLQSFRRRRAYSMCYCVSRKTAMDRPRPSTGIRRQISG